MSWGRHDRKSHDCKRQDGVRVAQVLRVRICHRKTHLVDIQFPETVLTLRKCAGKDGLHAT